MSTTPTRRQASLPGLLPVLYFGLAYLSLAVAFGERYEALYQTMTGPAANSGP